MPSKLPLFEIFGADVLVTDALNTLLLSHDREPSPSPVCAPNVDSQRMVIQRAACVMPSLSLLN